MTPCPFPKVSVDVPGGRRAQRGGDKRDISSGRLLIRRDNAGEFRACAFVCVCACVCVCVCLAWSHERKERERPRAFICLLAGPRINNAAIRTREERVKGGAPGEEGAPGEIGRVNCHTLSPF